MAYQSWSVVFGEQPSAAKWNILGTNDASFNDGTGIGTGVITAAKLATAPSRFVILNPHVSVVSVNPSGTTWTAVAVTANTSATATAALLKVGISSNTTVGRFAYLRPTGGSNAQDDLTAAAQNQTTASTIVWNTTPVKLNSSQSFDYSVSNADVDSLKIIVCGYWETVA